MDRDELREKIAILYGKRRVIRLLLRKLLTNLVCTTEKVLGCCLWEEGVQMTNKICPMYKAALLTNYGDTYIVAKSKKPYIDQCDGAACAWWVDGNTSYEPDDAKVKTGHCGRVDG